jgi:hypothetical protein
MQIYRFQAQLTRRLAGWAAASLLGGALLNISADPFRRALGQQFAGWAVVNAAIAFFGSRAARQRQAALPETPGEEIQAREAASLERLLWVNSGLDLGYIAGGALLAWRRGRSDRRAAGHGWGIVVQGAFLLFFDLVHAAALRRAPRAR